MIKNRSRHRTLALRARHLRRRMTKLRGENRFRIVLFRTASNQSLGRAAILGRAHAIANTLTPCIAHKSGREGRATHTNRFYVVQGCSSSGSLLRVVFLSRPPHAYIRIGSLFGSSAQCIIIPSPRGREKEMERFRCNFDSSVITTPVQL